MTTAQLTAEWIDNMSDDREEAKAQENRPTMTATVRQTFGGQVKTFGPYPFTPEADFDDLGATRDQLAEITSAAKTDGATQGYCEIVYRSGHGYIVDEEIAII